MRPSHAYRVGPRIVTARSAAATWSRYAAHSRSPSRLERRAVGIAEHVVGELHERRRRAPSARRECLSALDCRLQQPDGGELDHPSQRRGSRARRAVRRPERLDRPAASRAQRMARASHEPARIARVDDRDRPDPRAQVLGEHGADVEACGPASGELPVDEQHARAAPATPGAATARQLSQRRSPCTNASSEVASRSSSQPRAHVAGAPAREPRDPRAGAEIEQQLVRRLRQREAPQPVDAGRRVADAVARELVQRGERAAEGARRDAREAACRVMVAPVRARRRACAARAGRLAIVVDDRRGRDAAQRGLVREGAEHGGFVRQRRGGLRRAPA